MLSRCALRFMLVLALSGCTALAQHLHRRVGELVVSVGKTHPKAALATLV